MLGLLPRVYAWGQWLAAWDCLWGMTSRSKLHLSAKNVDNAKTQVVINKNYLNNGAARGTPLRFSYTGNAYYGLAAHSTLKEDYTQCLRTYRTHRKRTASVDSTLRLECRGAFARCCQLSPLPAPCAQCPPTPGQRIHMHISRLPRAAATRSQASRCIQTTVPAQSTHRLPVLCELRFVLCAPLAPRDGPARRAHCTAHTTQ